MNKKDLSEHDICSKFISPAVKRAGWDGMMQSCEEVAFTKGRIVAEADELMSLCDHLETQLTTIRDQKRGPFDAVLHHALNNGLQLTG